MKVTVFSINSFINKVGGGNPAGVVLNADELSDAQMQQIASEVGFSETAFVAKSQQADYKVRFFTPTDEVDFCGHATLAVFWLLKNQELVKAGSFCQETKAGLLGVTVFDDDSVVMEQAAPIFLEQFEAADVAAMLGISPDVILDTRLPIIAVSTGLVDAIVPISAGYLDKVIPNQPMLTEFSKLHNLVGFHLFELPNTVSEYSASCRNFAPFFGIDEESATGSSCGALACYLTTYYDTSIVEFVFEQGRAMGCSSRLTATVEKSCRSITKVKVGGNADIIELLLVDI